MAAGADQALFHSASDACSRFIGVERLGDTLNSFPR